MNALFLLNDPTVFDPHSAQRARHRAYADAIGELHVLSCAGRGAVSVRDGALTLHAGRGSKVRSLFTFGARARRLIREHGIEVVSAQDPFEHGWLARTIAEDTGARLHVQVHTDFLSPAFARESPFHRARVRLALRSVLPAADAVQTVSSRVRRSVIDRYGPPGASLASVIPPALPRHAPRPAALPPHDFSFVCLAVGRLAAEKHYHDLLAAFARVQARHRRAGLFIAGDGWLRRRLRHLARSLGIAQAVVFLGHHDEARALLPAADAFIQASAYEGYGITFVESALAGVPIVATDVGIMGDVFQADRDVLISPAGDVDALAAHLARLVRHDRVRHSLARNARAAVLAHLHEAGDIPQRLAADLDRTIAVPRVKICA